MFRFVLPLLCFSDVNIGLDLPQYFTFSLKIEINGLYFADKKIKEELNLKNNFAVKSHSKGDFTGFLLLSMLVIS